MEASTTFIRAEAFTGERFAQYVAAGVNIGHRPDLYACSKRVLGSEEFVDASIHRIGQTESVPAAYRRAAQPNARHFVRRVSDSRRQTWGRGG